MQTITSVADLKDAILRLEDRKVAEQLLLKESYEIIRERLKPANIVRNTFNQVFTGPNLVRTAMIGTAGAAVGYITKRYFRGFTGRILRRLLGRLI